MTTHPTPIPHSAATRASSTLAMVGMVVSLVLFCLAWVPAAVAGEPAFDISHSPDPATDRDRVTINISGVHNNSCVPSFKSGQVNEGAHVIEIVLQSPSNANCSQVITPWNVSARTASPLPAGWWTVKVYWGSIVQSYRFEVFRWATDTSRVGFSNPEYDTGESANTVFLTVERSGSSDGTVTVDFRTRDGSAEAGRDYEYTAGTLTWYHGDTSPKRIPVVIHDDQREEDEEYFRVELSGLSGNAERGTHFEARVTIQDDDGYQNQGNCRSDAYTLCLLENRYEVTARWRTKDGKSGRGQAKTLTGQSGYFWFFSESNVEVLVKMVDGCSLTKTHWVFASGMTNVWVEITVEDTWTQQQGVWTNPQDRDFRLIKDLDRFRSCN